MNLYGKILVFMNLVFALVTGAFIVTAYINRTNWKAAYDQLDKYYTVAQANADAYYAEANEAKKRADEEVKRITRDLDNAKAELARITADREQKEKDLATVREQALAQGTNATSSDAELNRRKDEVKALEGRLADANAKYFELQQKFKQAQDERMAATIARDSEHERNVRLLDMHKTVVQEYEAAKKRLANLGAAATTVAMTRNPPPEDVEGVVTESDAKTGLATISIGSDHGLSVGNTLEVYRTKPKPMYLGTIRILDTQAHQAVGRLTAPPRYGPIKEGDTVATKIMSSRSLNR